MERPRSSQRGHLYFELVEKGSRDEIVGKLDAVVWRRDLERIRRVLRQSEQKITAGVVIRCRGQVDFYAPSGRLQFVVREIDPVFTLGYLAERRRETLRALAAAGLLEKNRALPLPPLPLTVGLVTSRGSAAYHDFVSTLAESPYGFRVLLAHAAVQGRDAEQGVQRALRALAGTGVDCACVVRGGGSRSDLAAFDSRAIAEAIARAPFAVLTGLGHEIDETIADRVAHGAFKTPTKVAGFLVECVATAERSVDSLARALFQAGHMPLARAGEAVRRAHRGLRLAELRMSAAAGRLRELGSRFGALGRRRIREAHSRRRDQEERLQLACPRLLERRRRQPEDLGRRLVALAGARLGEKGKTLAALERLCFELAPERTLERGFSITRDQRGQLVRRASQVAVGDELTTQLRDGQLRSRVESS